MSRSFPPGTMPARGFNWDRVVFPPRRVGEFADLLYGKSLVETKRTSGSVPVYGTNGRCGWHNEALRAGPGVILGRKGQGPLGVEWCDGPFWVIDTAYFATASDDIDLKWFYYIVKYVGLNHLKSGEKPGLQRDTFRAQLFPFPPKNVQTAIAHVLSVLDAKLARNLQVNTDCERLASALFRSWFVDFDPVVAKRDGKAPIGVPAEAIDLFPDHFEDSELGPVPQGWRVGTIRDVCELRYGKALPERARTEGNVPVIGSNGVVGWHAEALVNGPGIVIGRKGTAGSVIWISGDFFPIDTTFYVYPRSGVPLNWLYELLADLDLTHYSGDSAVPGLNRETAHSLKIAIPDEALLGEFDRLCTPLRAAHDHNLSESRSLASLREALVGPLLSGELTIKAAEKIVEAAV